MPPQLACFCYFRFLADFQRAARVASDGVGAVATDVAQMLLTGAGSAFLAKQAAKLGDQTIKKGLQAIGGVASNANRRNNRSSGGGTDSPTKKSVDYAGNGGKGEDPKKDSGTKPPKSVVVDNGNNAKGTGEADIPPAFKQTEFSSPYEARLNQTPAPENPKVGFEGTRGESMCTLKPPPDQELKKILDEAGINGIEYRNAVPDFSPVSKAQLEIDYMVGGTRKLSSSAREMNFVQADHKLADQLNKSPDLARQFGLEPGEITAKDIRKYRLANKSTWHEVNDAKTIQLVPSEINRAFGHLGGVGEINSGAFMPGGFAANKNKERLIDEN